MQKVKLTIIDDGTLDTVVHAKFAMQVEYFRFDSEYRFMYANDDEFLNDVAEQLEAVRV